MNISKAVPIAVIATITILVGGGALYLKIKPGPGKEATVTKTETKQQTLTPAEEAVKRAVEGRFASKEKIYRNATYREIKNDGYEAVVIADVETKEWAEEGDEWTEQRAIGTTKLVGQNWTTPDITHSPSLYFVDKRKLRFWRDVVIHKVEKISGVSTNDFADICGEAEATTRYIAYLDAENKGSESHTFQFSMELIGKNSQKREGKTCTGGYAGRTRPVTLELAPNYRGSYSVTLDIDPDSLFGIVDECCLYEEAKEDQTTQHGKLVNFISVDGAELSQGTEIESTWNKWLENTLYLENL